jgi:hypothetical protein
MIDSPSEPRLGVLSSLRPKRRVLLFRRDCAERKADTLITGPTAVGGGGTWYSPSLAVGKPVDVLTAVLLPVPPEPRAVSSYRRHRRYLDTSEVCRCQTEFTHQAAHLGFHVPGQTKPMSLWLFEGELAS